MNFYEINYSFYADQMNNQFQNIDVQNNAPNSTITVDAALDAGTARSVDLSPARWPGSTPHRPPP